MTGLHAARKQFFHLLIRIPSPLFCAVTEVQDWPGRIPDKIKDVGNGVGA